MPIGILLIYIFMMNVIVNSYIMLLDQARGILVYY